MVSSYFSSLAEALEGGEGLRVRRRTLEHLAVPLDGHVDEPHLASRAAPTAAA